MEPPRKCQHEGCTEEGNPCYLDDDLLADPQRVTEYLCCNHAPEHGYCWCCGRFFAGIESFDFGNGLCEDCRVELLELEPDEEDMDYGDYGDVDRWEVY